MNTEHIIGSEFEYIIDKSYGLSADGYIATGTESIVYKGLKISKDRKMKLSCVLKFKYKSIKIGNDDNSLKTVNVLERFKKNDLKIFDDLQSCRSVVRIYDMIEDLGDFSFIHEHVPEGEKNIRIDKTHFFCVVEEYIDGWSLEEYCRDEYWKLTETVDIGNNVLRRKSFHEFPEERKAEMLESYRQDYDEVIRYQDEMLSFMLNLCEVLEYITDEKKILHLDIKPDNIMVTKHGRQIVLIDFGRAEYIPEGQNYVQNQLSQADYNTEESIARMFQYGTLGYAAPECYVAAANGSVFPFEDEHIAKGKMRIESDIFSFGATFWECLSLFELYTGSKEFAKDKGLGGSYDFYRKHILNTAAYCNRDLSLASPHYHERLEKIIQKCTRARTSDFDEENDGKYYNSYSELKDDILYAKASIPTLVKTENIKVRNAFGVAGVMLGLLFVLLIVSTILKFSGSYFAQQKFESVMSNYNPTRIEWLESAAVEQMESSNDSEKQSIYQKTYDFLMEQSEFLDYTEVVTLTNLLTEVSDVQFVGEAVNCIMKNVEREALTRSIQYIATNIDGNIASDGYVLVVQIYNAQEKENLLECYLILQQYISTYESGHELMPLVKKLAQTLNHDDVILRITQEIMEDSPTSEDEVEIRTGIRRYLEQIS